MHYGRACDFSHLPVLAHAAHPYQEVARMNIDTVLNLRT